MKTLAVETRWFWLAAQEIEDEKLLRHSPETFRLALEEIESIALHTTHKSIRRRCLNLLAANGHTASALCASSA